MGKNQRARRAAKQRQRTRPQSERRSTPTSESPRSEPSQDPLADAGQAFAAALQLRRRGLPAAQCVVALVAGPDEPIDKVVDLASGDLMRTAFSRGWTPVDFVEIGRREAEPDAAAYLLDELVAVTAEFPDALVHPRWRAQLDGFDAAMTWDPRRPRLSQWARRHVRTRHEALAMVVGLLSLIERLPLIEPVMTPPGTPLPRGTVTEADPAQAKALAKVRALLAKAESTEFEHEAEAYSAKAQELMTRYALDRALVDHASGVKQHATLRRIWLDNPYVTAKSLLVDAVAKANRCRTVFSPSLGFTTVLGDEVDLTVVELLTTSLQLQGTRAMLAAGSQRDSRGVSRARSYRQSFLVAYAGRIGERLRAANEAATAETDSGALLPVLSDRKRAVDDLMGEHFPNVRAKSISVANAAGYGAGRAAADLAQLDVRQSLRSD
jgi:Protein of unknown function (DUF2786)